MVTADALKIQTRLVISGVQNMRARWEDGVCQSTSLRDWKPVSDPNQYAMTNSMTKEDI